MLSGRRFRCLLMRAGAAKHVGVKVVPTEIAHQKRSHAAFAGQSKLPLFEGAGRCEGMRHSDCVCDGRTGGPGDRGCWQGGVGGAMLLSLIAKSPNLDAASGGANRACEPALTAVLEGNWMPRAGLGAEAEEDAAQDTDLACWATKCCSRKAWGTNGTSQTNEWLAGGGRPWLQFTTFRSPCDDTVHLHTHRHHEPYRAHWGYEKTTHQQ